MYLLNDILNTFILMDILAIKILLGKIKCAIDDDRSP